MGIISRIKQNKNKYRRGASLLSIIMVLGILSILGMSISVVTLNNYTQARSIKSHTAAFYDAEGYLRQAADAVRKAASLKAKILSDDGATSLNSTFLTDVISQAQALLTDDILLDSSGGTRIAFSIPDADSTNLHIQITAVGESAGVKRTASMIMTLAPPVVTTPKAFDLYPDYGAFIGADVHFTNKVNASTQLYMNPQGIVDGSVTSSIASVYNVSYQLPDGFAWWDDMQTSLTSYFSGKSSGTVYNQNGILAINAISPSYSGGVVSIQRDASTYKIGALSFSSLADKIVLINGNVTFNKNMLYKNGRTTHLMVIATGNITIDMTGFSPNPIVDPLFLYAGGDITYRGTKNGATDNLMAYAGDSYTYINGYSGGTVYTLNGQLLVKNDLNISVVNGSITYNLNYDADIASYFYDKLDGLADLHFIDGNSSATPTGLLDGILFTEGKIIEIKQ